MIQVRKVTVDSLKIGMYVSSLDRPWLETPFALQGFLVNSQLDIDKISKFCEFVYVDFEKSEVQDAPPRKRSAPVSRPRKTRQELFPSRTLSDYRDAGQFGDEYPKAKQAITTLTAGVTHIFDSVTRGSGLDVVKVKRSVEPMVESITRNPDACIWLARMKQADTYTYQHSIGCSIWAVALGRQLGLPKPDLRSLAIGGLLFDVGKLQVDKELIDSNRKLSDEEYQVVQNHVQLGLDAVKKSGLMNKDALEMIEYHHERHDGSGYPRGLKGDQIPIFARIAAIVDCYDAITSHRSYAKALPPSIAIKMLYEWRDVDFQAELVEEFIQAVGIYPAGTLVELSSGQVGVVLSEYRTRRLRPKVMILLDSNKKPVMDVQTINLLETTHTEDGKPLDIVNSLEPDAYGIDLAGIQL
jgi:HD-GYP domain-containing protein (c-di-GMP phosphodiesterase class II)